MRDLNKLWADLALSKRYAGEITALKEHIDNARSRLSASPPAVTNPFKDL